MLKKLKRAYYYSGAAVVTSFFMAAEAHAQTKKINDISKNMVESISDVPALLAGLAYLFGILLAVLGILQLKDHVENPSQTPLKNGAVRLAAGGALFALPIVYDAAETMFNPDGTPLPQTSAVLDAVQFKVRSGQ